MSARILMCALLGLGLALPGCATLPSSGPTARQILRGAERDPTMTFQVVELDATAAAALVAPAATGGERLEALARPAQPIVVGVGDTVNVTLYEIGVSLFGSSGAVAGAVPAARGERFPALTVDAGGDIVLPYIGKLHVAGSTPAQIGQEIDQRLIARSQSPQAIVTVNGDASNAVFVAGDVRKPSRLSLSERRERVLDAIAIAGGAAFPIDDVVVRLTRDGRTVEQRLGTIVTGSADDLLLIPGDRLDLVRRARSYTVFGAPSRVAQVAFEAGQVSLAEAIARVGGPSDAAADPSAVFLFRDGVSTRDGDSRPVIYRLDLLRPASYFVAQRVAMRDKDVLYIANAAANQPSKLVAIVNQLFAPFVTVRAATR